MASSSGVAYAVKLVYESCFLVEFRQLLAARTVCKPWQPFKTLLPHLQVSVVQHDEEHSFFEDVDSATESSLDEKEFDRDHIDEVLQSMANATEADTEEPGLVLKFNEVRFASGRTPAFIRALSWLCPPAQLKLDLCPSSPGKLMEALKMTATAAPCALRIRDCQCNDKMELQHAVRFLSGSIAASLQCLEWVRSSWPKEDTTIPPLISEVVPMCIGPSSLTRLVFDVRATQLGGQYGYDGLPNEPEQLLQLSAFAALPRLKELWVLASFRNNCDSVGHNSTSATASALCRVKQLRKLMCQTFIFLGDEAEDAAALAAMIVELPLLEELGSIRFARPVFWHELRRRIGDSARPPKLRVLWLCFSEASEEDLVAMVHGLEVLPSLEVLYLILENYRPADARLSDILSPLARSSLKKLCMDEQERTLLCIRERLQNVDVQAFDAPLWVVCP